MNETPINDRPISEESKKVLTQADALFERTKRLRYELSYQWAREYRKQLEPMLNNITVTENELDLCVETFVDSVIQSEVKPSHIFSGEL